MSYYEKWSCRIAIQVCIGYFPDGRERHKTFSMRDVNPDASLEAIAEIVRALAHRHRRYIDPSEEKLINTTSHRK